MTVAKVTPSADDIAPVIETYPALENVPGCRHGFVRRIPGIDVVAGKAEALARLDTVHTEARRLLGLGQRMFVTAQQVHGSAVAAVDRTLGAARCFSDCDALITNRRDVCLGIYVADCCAVFLFDPVNRAIALVHSGRKGTGLGIVSQTIARLTTAFGSVPADLIVQLSPCIRPPHYEIDFASGILAQCHSSGVRQVHDGGVCTACDLDHYYSYRAEKARTGRMLALLALS